jgi:hypothetical protein
MAEPTVGNMVDKEALTTIIKRGVYKRTRHAIGGARTGSRMRILNKALMAI